MKKLKIVFLISAIGLMLFPVLFIALTPDVRFSENENRALNGRPEISLNRVLDGSFQQRLNEYISDQLPFRDILMEEATVVKKILGYQEIGGAYLGKNHHYMKKVTEEDMKESYFDANIRTLSAFLKDQDNLNQCVLFVPDAGISLREDLPANAPFYDADAYYKNAADTLGTSMVDLREKFAGREDYYYRTDHHWTARGAYAGYEECCKKLGLPVRDFESFGPSCVSHSFLGSLYSKVLDPRAKADDFIIYKNLPELTLTIERKVFASIYDEEKLEKKDKYAAFFGGNYGTLSIETKAATGRKLLCVKDSFANCMVPYLLNDYEEIVMIDLRYFHGNPNRLIEEKGITDILVVYELSNFAENIFLTMGG